MNIRNFAAQWIAEHIDEFQERKRLHKLRKLKLHDLTSRKNPYLFRVKGMETGEQIIRSFLDAALSSSEETTFGDWMEQLAIAVAMQAVDGRKSTAKGIDLEIEKEGCRFLIAIKSGPNWGNSSQISKMMDYFRQAGRILCTSGHREEVRFINGCIYGKDRNPFKEKGYWKYCGQAFWEFISGSDTLYQDIIEPLGHEAAEWNALFEEEYNSKVNTLTREFLNAYCNAEGRVDWHKLLKHVSGSRNPK